MVNSAFAAQKVDRLKTLYPCANQILNPIIFILRRFYSGTTDDVNRRMEEHNSGKYPDSFSVKGMPWNLFLAVECETGSRPIVSKLVLKECNHPVHKRIEDRGKVLDDLLERFK